MSKIKLNDGTDIDDLNEEERKVFDDLKKKIEAMEDGEAIQKIESMGLDSLKALSNMAISDLKAKIEVAEKINGDGPSLPLSMSAWNNSNSHAEDDKVENTSRSMIDDSMQELCPLWYLRRYGCVGMSSTEFSDRYCQKHRGFLCGRYDGCLYFGKKAKCWKIFNEWKTSQGLRELRDLYEYTGSDEKTQDLMRAYPERKLYSENGRILSDYEAQDSDESKKQYYRECEKKAVSELILIVNKMMYDEKIEELKEIYSEIIKDNNDLVFDDRDIITDKDIMKLIKYKKAQSPDWLDDDFFIDDSYYVPLK